MSELNAGSFNVNDVSLDEKALAVADLCKYWPDAKKWLGLAKDVIKNPIVKGVISGLILVGDSLCP